MRVSHLLLSAGLLLAGLLGVSALLGSDSTVEALGQAVAPESAAEVTQLAEAHAQRAPLLPDNASVEVVRTEHEEAAGQSRAWEIVAQLEVLAERPGTFHELALPLIAQLDEACAEPEDVQEIFEQVIAGGTREELVRGAALLGIATRLTRRDFERVFLGWFGGSDTSLELLRAAGMASALRGSRSYCSLPLDLRFLGQLQSAGDSAEVPLPRIYPLQLERIPSAVHLDVLRNWLDEARTAVNEVEPPEIGEFFVTAEVLFAVWGQAALQESEVERVVLAEGHKGPSQRAASNVMYLRVANFLVHSLAPCNDRMFDLSVQMSESEDSVTALLSAKMSEHLAGGLGVALMAKIEGLRYSTEPGASANLSTHLLEVGEGLGSIADPYELELAVSYLNSIVQDPIVDGTARSIGMLVLSEHAPWEVLLASASETLQPGAPDEVHAVALTALVEGAGSDRDRRTQVVALFEEALGYASDGWSRESLHEYINILSQ